ncbi:MAG TPA: gephyrin-like molybdotransferase Glp [Chthoniobacterales bacterium]|jgi:molybdopterin molybdotransferase|nr:gephyrin-like molybdotransferase Glp [Chthoniobacterales bacterium]
MISESEARAKILDAVQPLPARKMPIQSALDRFAAEDSFARFSLPMFDNSAMDGYAVIASDCKVGKRLRVVGEQPAGVNRKLRVSNGTTVRIFTGAPMPAGSDAVVMQEDVTREGDEIVVNAAVNVDESVRKRGCDLGERQKILSKGERITATKLALLASQGFADVLVGGEVRAAIISTGDELAMPGEKLYPGQIYDSNSVLLQSLLELCGATITSTGRCSDDAGSLQKEFLVAAKNEILIVTGGVSVGEHDLVQAALRKLGAKIDIWRVAIKPGKPFLFGTLGSCFVFGLPGNPVSAFVTFLQFVRVAILKMMAADSVDLARLTATLTVDQINESERVHYVRGKFENGRFTPIGRQESHALFGLSQSNALLRLDRGESLHAGETVHVQVWC